MKTLNQKLQKYHLVRISKRHSVEYADKIRLEIMKEKNYNIKQFHDIYFDYIKSLGDKYK